MPSSSPSSRPDALAPDGISRWLGVLFFCSGAVALVYEAAWQRQFALVLGSSASATASVLAAYFAGIGAGSIVVGRSAERLTRPLAAYALLEAGVGAGALLVSPLLAAVDLAQSALYHSLGGNPAWLFGVRVMFAFVTLLPPTFCLGGTLPLLAPVVDRGRRRWGESAGWLYTANTAGATFGVLALPFLLFPHLGLARSVWFCAALNFLLAAGAWRLDRSSPSTSTSARVAHETAAAERVPLSADAYRHLFP